MRLFMGIATALVVAGLFVTELFKTSRDWLNVNFNLVLLAMTALALLAAAYAADQARRAVLQATHFRDIDRLEDIRGRVEILITSPVGVTLQPELSAFNREILPQCYTLNDTLPVENGASVQTSLVVDAQGELTRKLTKLRKLVY